MRCSLDTNVLVYAEGFGDEVRVSAARHVLERLEPDDVVIPVQSLGELFRVLTTKAGLLGISPGGRAQLDGQLSAGRNQ
jgi:predicted nucleic acid-binding protein